MMRNGQVYDGGEYNAVAVKELCKQYECRGRLINALSGIDLSIHGGEHVCVIGRSGSGKSTLTRMICGIEMPSSGVVEVFGKNPVDMLQRDRTHYSKTIQLVRQESYMTFDPLYTVQDALMRVVALHQKQVNGRSARLQFISALMERFEMQDLLSLLRRKPKELSGGQLQRFALLRAFLVSPRIVVADEPTAMLDLFTTKKMVAAFERIPKGTTFIYVTHSEYLTSALANRIIHVENGKCI